MNGDDVAVFVNFVMGYQLDPQVMGPFDGNIRIAGEYFAFKGFETGGDASADFADADDPGNFTFQFVSGKRAPVSIRPI